MFIEAIKLVNYKYLPFYGSNVFEKEFTEKTILIEGINGSGKSRILSELLPLPADKEFFNEGGLKYQRIRHKNQTYELISDFTKKTPFYSFTIDGGENLNMAGIISTQKDLCFEHFGMTTVIKEILADEENFTNMTIPTRKKICSQMTKLNIDHVMKSYGKLNDEFNLQKLVLKNEQYQLKLEETKLISPEELEETRESLNKLNETLDQLLETRNFLSRFTDDNSSDRSLDDLKNLIVERKQLIDKYYTLFTNHSKSSLEKSKLKVNENIAKANTQLDHLYSKLEESLELKKTLGFDIDGSNLEEERKNILNEMERLSKGLKVSTLDLRSYGTFESTYLRVRADLMDFIPDFPVNQKSDGTYIYNKAEIERSITRRDELAREYSEMQALEMSLREHHNHSNDGSIMGKCPSCNYSGELNSFMDKLGMEERMVFLNSKMNQIREEMKTYNKYIEESHDYYRKYKEIMSLKKSTEEVLPLFWKVIEDRNLILGHPSHILVLLNELTFEYNQIRMYKELNEKLIEIDSQLNTVNNLKGVSINDVNTSIRETEVRIDYFMRAIEHFKKEYSLLEITEEGYKCLEIITKRIENAKGNVRDYMTDYMAKDVIQVLDTRIRDVRIRALELTKVISEQDNVKYLLESLNNKIADIEDNILVLSTILNEVSPKHGIIAKTISGFLNTIINNVNKTLDKLWSYKMTLTPIDIETDTLNYKFKVEVEDKLSVPDISKASRGMKEAINLSFKLVLYQLLGFQEYPLILDELASNMDKENTEGMSRLIQSLSTDGNFGQIFIVSHKEDMSFLRDSESFSLS